MNCVDIVIPVYKGLEETRACLSSVLAAATSDAFAIHVIYDAGPDPQVERYLDDLHEDGLIGLHKNSINMGFVKSVNRGFALHPERDVIILNSDTVVPAGWAERLQTTATSSRSVATVTPYSNNGEICSFPRICQCNELPAGMNVDAVDQFFRDGLSSTEIVLPTGVGFCMYITRAALRDIGGFDEQSFGLGYGEENDFCRRAIAKGYRNLLCANLFVYHAGGVSFGDEKAARIANALKIIDRRYPTYAGEVNKFIVTDPPRMTRARVLASMLVADKRRMILHVSHNMGGGTHRYVEQLAQFNQEAVCFLTLAPVSASACRLFFPSWMGEALQLDISRGLTELLDILRGLQVSGVIVSHVKGFETIVLPLLDALDVPVWSILHDYYFLAGNPTLTDANGCIPSELNEELVLSDSRSSNFSDLGRERWMPLVHPILHRSQRVIAPTPSVKQIYERFMPELVIDVHPHPDSETIVRHPDVSVRRPGKSKSKKRIVAIGALGKEKGADLLENVAVLSARRDRDIEFHLLGYAYRTLDPAVITHGVYTDDQLPQLLQNLDADLVWYPCQWPETYSYTLSVALEVGLPLLVPNLGALADRCAGRPATAIAAYPQTPEQWLEQIRAQLALLDTLPDSIAWSDQEKIEPFYRNPPWAQTWQSSRERALDFAVVAKNLAVQSSSQYYSEQVLAFLFRIRAVPFIRTLMQLVPLERQRRFKRWLSKKPLHEIATQ